MNEQAYCRSVIRESVYGYGRSSFGVFFALIALILTSWFIYLIIRRGRFSDCIAFVAATFFPLGWGWFITALGMIQYLQRESSSAGGPGPPTWQDCASLELCLSLIVGTSLTCLFLPLGLALLWLRQPKSSAGDGSL